MTKIGFDPQAIGRTRDEVEADVREPVLFGAFIPVVPSSCHVGVEAIKEGLRLAHIQGTILDDAVFHERAAKHVHRR